MPGRTRLLLLTAPLLLLLGLPTVAHAAPAPTGTTGGGERVAAVAKATEAAEATEVTAGAPRAARTSVPRFKQALRIARHQIGDPYKYGAEGPRRFDCSGLVYYSTHRAGLTKVPRSSAQQAQYMRRIPRKQLQRGDYLFFTGGGGVYHVGLFVGREHGGVYVVHAPHSGAKVRRERVWTNAWFAGTLRR